MHDLVLSGGTVLTPTGHLRSDVAIADGSIVAVGEVGAARRTVDCTGCYIGPGFVDLHVHFREPGQEWKEDIETGSQAAAAGGFTAVVAMANTEPATDTPRRAAYITDRGREVGLVEVMPAGAITVGRRGRAVADVEAMWEQGVRIFSDDGDSVADPSVLTEALERVGRLGGIVAQHAEDPAMTRDGHMHEGVVSHELGIGGLPAAAEELIVERDLDLVRRTGARYHIQHVSTAGTVALLRAAKREGLPVTAEVAPHHLALDHRRLRGRDTVMKMYPPLRTEDDQLAVRTALRDRTIDAVATDHAPHTASEKAVAFEAAPRGVIGLETAVPIVWSTLGADPTRLFECMSVNPATIGRFADQGRWPAAGNVANLTVFDPEKEWVPATFQSRSQNSPWLGVPLIGKARYTVFQGRLTHE